MNDVNTLQKEWEQMRIRTRETETEKDLNRIENKLDRLTRLVQERYDQSRELASQSINRLLTRSGARMEETREGVRGRTEEATQGISRLMSESGSRLQATREAMMERADDVVAGHPWRTSLAALLMGIVLGLALSPDRWRRA